MFQFIIRKNLKCIGELSIDAIEEHSFDEPVQRQTMGKFGVGRTLTVELPNCISGNGISAVLTLLLAIVSVDLTNCVLPSQ